MKNNYIKNAKISEGKFRQILKLFCLEMDAQKISASGLVIYQSALIIFVPPKVYGTSSNDTLSFMSRDGFAEKRQESYRHSTLVL